MFRMRIKGDTKIMKKELLTHEKTKKKFSFTIIVIFCLPLPFMRQQTHIILLSGCVLCLLAMGIVGIAVPLRFEKNMKEREKAVMSHLHTIIQAEERYQASCGRYTPHFGDLIGGGFLADTLCVIPYSHGELFTLTVDVDKDAAGQPVQTVDCSALYRQYLYGLDSRSIDNAIAEAGEDGRFPGLSLSRTSLITEETTK